MAAMLCLFTLIGITLPSQSLAAATYYTDNDNENNARLGTPDNDMDTLLSNASPEHPIEFNINVSAALPTSSAHLVINALDVNEELGETDTVSLNGNLLGNLSGIGGNNSSTVFEVPINRIVNGDNLVELTVSNTHTLTVNWGQLLIDGGAKADAEIDAFGITSIQEASGFSNLEIAIDLSFQTNGNYRLELSLVDPNGYTINL